MTRKQISLTRELQHIKPDDTFHPIIMEHASTIQVSH